MSIEWASAPLGELCEFRAGLWKSDKGPTRHVSVLRNTNFTPSGELDFSDVAQIDVEERAFLKRRLQPGDIMLEKSGGGPKQPVGRVCLFNEPEGDFSFSNFTAALTIRNRAIIEPRYLLRFLIWCYDSGLTATMQSHSTGIRNLDGNAYKTVSVPLPPLAEQHRIVAILDEAFEGLANVTANVQRYKTAALELFTSQIAEVLTGNDGWDTKALGEVCTLQRGFDLPVQDRKAGSVPLISSSGPIAFQSDAPVRAPGVVTGRSGSIGKVFWVSEDFWPLNTTLYVKDFHGNDPRFVFRLLQNFNLIRFAGGAGVPTLNRNSVHGEMVLVPISVKQQQQIAAQIDLLEKERDQMFALADNKLALVAELKQSFLARAFSGELTREALAA